MVHVSFHSWSDICCLIVTIAGSFTISQYKRRLASVKGTVVVAPLFRRIRFIACDRGDSPITSEVRDPRLHRDLSLHQVEPDKQNTARMFKIIFSFATFLLLLTGFAGAASYDAEIHLSVVEGENLTILTMTPRSEEDQVMFSQLKETSEYLIAQLSCFKNNCTNESSEPCFLIRYDAQSVTIILVNATRNQTGRYKVYAHRGTRIEIPTYNITVFGTTPRTTIPESPPSFMIGDQVAAGIGATVGILIMALIIGAICCIYYMKKMYRSVPVLDAVP